MKGKTKDIVCGTLIVALAAANAYNWKLSNDLRGRIGNVEKKAAAQATKNARYENATDITGVKGRDNPGATEKQEGKGRQALWDAVGADDSQVLGNVRGQHAYEIQKMKFARDMQ